MRERFRLNGVEICEEKYLAYFWWCYDRLKENSSEDVPMPTYFCFLALLASRYLQLSRCCYLRGWIKWKVRCNECGSIACSMRYNIPWVTLGAIAGEKAGIFKHGVPAFTVTQPDEAMRVLEEKASKLDVPLQVAPPLDASLLNGQKLGLVGEYQYLNAGLAIALSSTWLQRTGHLEVSYHQQTGPLPEQFIKGLTTANLQGRAQIVPDRIINTERPGDLVFYLDGAHSPESMEICARWFSLAIKEDSQQKTLGFQSPDSSGSSHELGQMHGDIGSRKNPAQILLFNCMSVRDPQSLLPRLMKTCASQVLYLSQYTCIPRESFKGSGEFLLQLAKFRYQCKS
ncbi:hypothetical protein Q3G72_028367 [Acer saccharum]|nr:hypothetical protein Q3G72_028367 [Acer saccharum]